MSKFRNPFRLRGSARRRELFAVAATCALVTGLGLWAQASEFWRLTQLTGPLTIVALMALLATMVRRLHDIGRSGAWVACSVVPVFGLGLAAVLLLWPPVSRKRDDVGFGTMLGVLALALMGVAAAVRIFFAPYQIANESMKPALLIGDLAMVRYRDAADISRGDVIMFRNAAAYDHALAKRVIGLPGDRVSLVGGQVYLNGALLAQNADGRFSERMEPQGPRHQVPRCEGGAVGYGGQCGKSRFVESLPEGRSYAVLNIEDGSFSDDMAEVTVPEASFFVLGDNRDASLDSRHAKGIGGLGFVPATEVVGTASFILLSSEGEHLWYLWDWRFDRWLMGVK